MLKRLNFLAVIYAAFAVCGCNTSRETAASRYACNPMPPGTPGGCAEPHRGPDGARAPTTEWAHFE